MPKREYTSQNLREAIASGQVKADEIYKLTVSLTYAQFLDMLELREELRKSTSELIRDGITALRRNHRHDMNPAQMDIEKIKAAILQDQQVLKAELLNGVKKLAGKEGEGSDALRGHVIAILEDTRFSDGLTTKDLAKFANVDWHEIDKVCARLEEGQLVTREGSKWKLVVKV